MRGAIHSAVGGQHIPRDHDHQRHIYQTELKTILEAHRDQRLLPAHTRLSYLLLRVADLCEQTDFHSRYGASRTSLEAKLKRLDNTEATALMVWASAFWVSRNCSAANMDDYIASY